MLSRSVSGVYPPSNSHSDLCCVYSQVDVEVEGLQRSVGVRLITDVCSVHD